MPIISHMNGHLRRKYQLLSSHLRTHILSLNIVILCLDHRVTAWQPINQKIALHQTANNK
ncbi:hypothetical protein D3C77_586970 [compost metagenome]